MSPLAGASADRAVDRLGLGDLVSADADASPLYSLECVGTVRERVGRARDAEFTDAITHWPHLDAGRETVLEEVAADVLPSAARRWATRRSARAIGGWC
ncbi:hypothetical protein [Actinokineospora iranica]|uniref:Uncharacterized protein n=1 Tax=Actinokineospora iranica TaxID=1271860 RepID=A0A1G6KH90_9PSEU|nr:hypothetical protein [Actinokineospora iranica]SDC30287.1 hypothetical protein SAMN05216174_101909 [Actinokineospora iranica]